MPVKTLNLSKETVVEIESRVDGDGREKGAIGASRVVERDLQRYYVALRYARAELRKILTPDEIALIVDNLNGVVLWDEPEISVRGIPLNVSDGIELESLDKKWKVSGPSLIKKLNKLSFTQLNALADAVENFWRSNGSEDSDPRQALNDPK